MELRVVELVFHLLPHVVEDVGSLLVGAVVEVGLEVDALLRVLGEVYLLYTVVVDVEVLEVLVGLKPIAHALHHNLGLVLHQVVLPQVVATLETRLIIQGVTTRGEYGVCHVRRVDREAYDAVAAIGEVKLQRFHIILFLVAVFLLAEFWQLYQRFFGVFLFLFLLCLVVERAFLLSHAETLVGVEVEEHDVGIVFRSPAAMAAIAGAVAHEEHGLAAEHPLAVAVVVAAVGEVGYLLASVGRHEGYVAVVPSSIAYVVGEQPLAVWAPLEPQVAISVAVLELAVHELPHGLRLHVHGLERATVFDICHGLAIWTVSRLHVYQRRLHQLLLLELGGIGKLLLILVYDACLVDLPESATLRCVDEAAAVGRKVDVALLLWRVGDALSRGVVD